MTRKQGRIVLIGNKKGGVWKSMTVMNCAGVAANAGLKVCVVDADTNETCNSFVDRRNLLNDKRKAEGKPEYPYIQCVLKKPGNSIAKDLQSLSFENDLVLVDTGGYENEAFKTALRVADVVYLPFKPCTVDMEQLVPTFHVITGVESFIADLTPGFEIDARLLIIGADYNVRDKIQEAKNVAKDLLDVASISAIALRSVKAVVTGQDDGLTLADMKHPARSMFELLVDEALDIRKVACQRTKREN